MGKLAMWRLHSHEQFGGTWLSDYVPNRLGGFISKHEPDKIKPDCKLIGEDGNIFNLMGLAARTLRHSRLAEQATEMTGCIHECGSYDEDLCMATKKTNNATKSKIPVSAKIDRMIERENATVKAYASANIGGAFVIKDIAVVDGQKGMFARMPFRSYKTGSGETKYSDIVFALTDEARQSVNDAVLGAYREALEESEEELPDEDESPAQKM